MLTIGNLKTQILEFEDGSGNFLSLDYATVKSVISTSALVSDSEIMYFMQMCTFQQLNPFLREAYLIKYSETMPASIVVGKEAFAKKADADPRYEGYQAGIIVATAEGKQERREGCFYDKEIEKLLGGWCRVFKTGSKFPIYIEVALHEYEVKKKNGEVNTMWREKGATMIRKVAYVQAHREAIPSRLGALLIAEEVEAKHMQMAEKAPPTESEVAQVAAEIKQKKDAETQDLIDQVKPIKKAEKVEPEEKPVPEETKLKPVTICEEDERENGFFCRACGSKVVQDGDKNCRGCNSPLIWL